MTLKSRNSLVKKVFSSDKSFLCGYDWIRIFILSIITVCLWCVVTGRTDYFAWSVPLEYGTIEAADGDAQGVLAYIKAASEGEFAPFHINDISRAGAPYHAAWSDIPVIEKWQYFIPGILARFIGLFQAANAAVLISQLLACICLYIAVRLEKVSWPFAFSGAIVFGFSEFAFARSLHHLNVTNYWHIPLCILIAGWVSRGQLGNTSSKRFIAAFALSIIIGMQNPYYTNLYLQLVLLGAFYQYFQSGWRGLVPGIAIVAASGIGFTLMTSDTHLYHLLHGPNLAAIVRPFYWLEVFSLKLLDLFVPPPNHPLFAAIGRAYYGINGQKGMVAIPGEIPPSCYLGIIGITCFALLAIDSLRRVIHRPGKSLPMEAWQIIWIFAYSFMGGINCFLGLCGMTLFRCPNRYSIFILCIVLFYALRKLSSLRLSASTSYLIALAGVMIAVWDQTPPFLTTSRIMEQSIVVNDDREFTQSMEKMLPKRSMIFQIPVMEYPETPSPGMLSTDHFRPYLHSNDLKFSFGGVKGRPYLNWQKDLSGMSLQQVINTLEKCGFSAIYINRNGLPDRADGILKSLQTLGYTSVITNGRGDLACVLIHPDPNPILPAGNLE